jgi:hypothetical protein
MFFPFSNLDKNLTQKSALYPNGPIFSTVIKDDILYVGGTFSSLCQVYSPYAILDSGLNISLPSTDVRVHGATDGYSKFGYEKDPYNNHYFVGNFNMANNIRQVNRPDGKTSPAPAGQLMGRMGILQVTPSGVNTGLGFALGGGTSARNLQWAGTGIFFLHFGNNINIFNGNSTFNAATYGFGLYNQGLVKYNLQENPTNNYKWAFLPDRTWFQNFANGNVTNGGPRDYFIHTGDFYPNKTGVWVCGTFTTAAGGNWNRLVCLDYVSGTAITGFTSSAGPNGEIQAMFPSGDRIYFYGNFTSVGGVTRNRMAATTFPQIGLLPFNPNFNDAVRSMNPGSDGIYIGGNFTTIKGSANPIYRYCCKIDYESGDVITGFRPNSILRNDVPCGYINEFGDKVIIDYPAINMHAWTFRTNNSTSNPLMISGNYNPVVPPIIVDNISGLTVYTGLGQGLGQNGLYVGNNGGGFDSFQKKDDKILIFGKTQGAFIEKVKRNNAFAIDLKTNRITDWNPNVQMINAPTSQYSISNGTQGIWCMHLDTGDNTLAIGGRFNSVNSPEFTSNIRDSVAIVDLISGNLITNLNINFSNDTDVVCLEKSGDVLFMGGSFIANSIPNRITYFAGVDINNNEVKYGRNFEIQQTLFGLNSNKTGPSSNSRISCMRRNGDKLYVGGSFNQVSGFNRYGLFCLDISNNLITDFDLNLDRGEVKAMDIDKETNTLYIGGSFRRVLGQERNFGAAINLDTTGLLEWDPMLSKEPTNIRVTPSGVFTCGNFSNAGERRGGLAMFSIESGDLLKKPSFNLMAGDLGGVMTTEIYNNNLYINGGFNTATLGFSIGTQNFAPPANQIVYNLDSGNILTGFINNGAPICIRAGGTVRASFLESGFMYIGGEFTSVQNMSPNTNINSAVTRNRVAWFDLSNQRISGIDYNVNSTVWGIKRKDNFLYIGGQFTSVLGVARNRLARINLNNNTLDSWNPNLNGTVYDIKFSGDKMFVCGDFTTVSGLSRNRVCRFDISPVSGGALESYNPPVLGGGLRSIAITGNTLYLAGTTSQFGSAANNAYLGVAAFDINTAAHLTGFRPFSGYTVFTSYWLFNRNVLGTDGVSALHIHPSGLFVGGDILSISGLSDEISPRGVFLLDPVNGNILKNYGGIGKESLFRERPPAAFGDSHPGQIWSINTYNDKLIVGGEFGDLIEYRYMNSPSPQNYFMALKDKITGMNLTSYNFMIDGLANAHYTDQNNPTFSNSNNWYVYDASYTDEKIYFHGLFPNMRLPDFRCSIAAMDYNGNLDSNFKNFSV